MAEPTSLADALRRELFADEEANVYAVLDGASVPGLLGNLAEHQPEYTCLFSGQLDPHLAEAAPYLVRLEAEAPFTYWVLETGWGRHCGIFAAVPGAVPFTRMRKHMRSFLRVRDPEGKPLFFRYYDPRVFRVYLPTCNALELRAIFGQVATFMLEGKDAGTLLSFLVFDGVLEEHKVVLVE